MNNNHINHISTMKTQNLNYCFAMLLLSAIQTFGQASVRNYNIYNGNKLIGTLNAEKQQKGLTTTYVLNVSTAFTLLLRFQLVEKVREEFNGQMLIYSSAERLINSKTDFNHVCRYQNNGYLIGDKNNESTVLSSKISTSVCTLYFNEPVGVNYVYSHAISKMLRLEKTGPDEYTLHQPGGNRTVYKYDDGVCTEVASENTFSTVHIVLTHTCLK